MPDWRIPPQPPGGRAVSMGAWFLAPIPTLEACARRYGDAFSLDLGRFGRFVFLSDPGHVRTLFTGDQSSLNAGAPNAVLSPVVGSDSVLTTHGRVHLRQRKLLLAPFHGERMRLYRDEMVRLTDEEIERMPLGRPFALAPHTQRLTLRVIIGLVFGIADGQRARRLLSLIPRMARLATPVMLSEHLARDAGSWSPGGRFWPVLGEVQTLVREQIAERRAAGDAQGRSDVLSLLLAARDEEGRELSDRELVDHLMTLLFAGHETTATALAWGVDCVLHEPAVHERLRAELAGGDGAPYLDAVIKETHRLRPTVPNVVRRLEAPLEIGPWRLPPGVVVSPAIHLIHRRPDVYPPDPERFRPERFLDGDAPSYAWLPFGGGIRRCIGASFATLEMREALRRLFTRLELEPASARPERPMRRTVTSVPLRGARVVVRARS